EEVAIELFGPVRIRRVEIGPTGGARDLRDAGALVLTGLPYTNVRAGGILQYCHSTKIKDIERSGDDFATEFGAARRCFVRTGDSDVDHPVGRHSLRVWLLLQGVGCCYIAILEPEH